MWGSFGASANGGAGAGGSVGTLAIFDDEGNAAVVVIGFYGGATPNIGGAVDAFLLSDADNIFEFVMADAVSFGGSYTFVSVEGFWGDDSNKNLFGGFNISFGISAIPADLKGGIGYAYFCEIVAYHGRPVTGDVTMDFFVDMPAKYQALLHDQLGIPYVPYTPKKVTGGGLPWHAIEK